MEMLVAGGKGEPESASNVISTLCITAGRTLRSQDLIGRPRYTVWPQPLARSEKTHGKCRRGKKKGTSRRIRGWRKSEAGETNVSSPAHRRIGNARLFGRRVEYGNAKKGTRRGATKRKTVDGRRWKKGARAAEVWESGAEEREKNEWRRCRERGERKATVNENEGDRDGVRVERNEIPGQLYHGINPVQPGHYWFRRRPDGVNQVSFLILFEASDAWACSSLPAVQTEGSIIGNYVESTLPRFSPPAKSRAVVPAIPLLYYYFVVISGAAAYGKRRWKLLSQRRPTGYRLRLGFREPTVNTGERFNSANVSAIASPGHVLPRDCPRKMWFGRRWGAVRIFRYYEGAKRKMRGRKFARISRIWNSGIASDLERKKIRNLLK